MHRREIVRLCVLTKRMNAHFVQGHARSGQGVESLRLDLDGFFAVRELCRLRQYSRGAL